MKSTDQTIATAEPLVIQKLSASIGVVVESQNLAATHSQRVAQLRQLVTEYHVVFIRGFGDSKDEKASCSAQPQANGSRV